MTVQFIFLLDPEGTYYKMNKEPESPQNIFRNWIFFPDARLQLNNIDEAAPLSHNNNSIHTNSASGQTRTPVMINLHDCNEDERMIMDVTNCYNLELIRAALVEYQYNTALATEYIMSTVTKPNNDIKIVNRNASPTNQTNGRNNNVNTESNHNENDNNHSRNPYHGKKKGGKVKSLSSQEGTQGQIHPKLLKFALVHSSIMHLFMRN